MLAVDNLLDLHIDILSNILKYSSESSWIYLAICSPQVYEYTRLNRQIFADQCTHCTTLSRPRVWKIFGKLHRGNDLPAYVHANGSASWFQYGVRHRDTTDLNGMLLPAWISIYYIDKTRFVDKIYFLHGKECNERGEFILM